VAPNQGIFEQTLNALFLQREHLSHAVIDRPLSVPDVASFLNPINGYTERLRNRPPSGNKEAVAGIEGVLSRVLGAHPCPFNHGLVDRRSGPFKQTHAAPRPVLPCSNNYKFLLL